MQENFTEERYWECAAKGCDRKTSDWEVQGWVCVKFDEHHLMSRLAVEKVSRLYKSDGKTYLTAVLFCPEHQDMLFPE